MLLFFTFLETLRRIVNDQNYLQQSRVRNEDFTRMRKMSFPQYIFVIIKGTHHGLQSGLNEFFRSVGTEIKEYTKQAFSKGRLRIKPEAIKFLFDTIAKEYCEKAKLITYKNYRLTAIDGSRYNLPNSPELREKYGEQITSGQSQVQALSSCLYDVLNHIILDARIYPCKSNEREIAAEHIERLGTFEDKHFKELIILDRGYPSGKLMQLIENSGYFYLMRCNTEFLKRVKITGSDCCVNHTFLSMNGTSLTFRVITLPLPNGTEEHLITNILDRSFSVSDFGELYRLRWQIEEKYNDIKNKFQIENFSGTTETVILQDFYATMLLANLAQSIIYDNHDEIEALHNNDDNKYCYVMNIAMTISELKYNLIACLITDSKIKRQRLYMDMIRKLKKCVVPRNRSRNCLFSRFVAHSFNKFPMNKRFG